MPDQFDFDHLPAHGRVTHRCVQCGWPHTLRSVGEVDRRRHHAEHERTRLKQAEQARKQALANARKAKRALARENESAYGKDTNG